MTPVTGARMTLVAGVDTSTQACKVVVRDADTGRAGAAGPRAAPRRHRGRSAGLGGRLRRGGRGGRRAGRRGRARPSGASSTAWSAWTRTARVVRDALLWNDVRSAGAAADLIRELGRRRRGGRAAGLGGRRRASCRWPRSPRPSCAGWPTREPGERRPDGRGLPPPRLADLAARPADRDLGDAGHRPRRRQRHRLLVGPHRRVPPRPAGAGDARPAARRARGSPGRPRPVGHAARRVAPSWARAPATTPRPRSGLAARPGDVIVSIGTSGVVSAVTATAVADATGTVAGFADATGHHLPLVATLNAARVLDAAAALLGVDHADALRPRAVGAVRCRRAGAGALPGGRADAEPAARPPARCTG